MTVIAGRAVPGRRARVRSSSFDQVEAFDVDEVGPDVANPETWGRYIQGVAWALREAAGSLASGFDAAMAGDVPIGAGLSSSASLQAAFAFFLAGAGLSGTTELDSSSRMALAHVLRRSENEYVGVASGLLDQFSVLFGRADHAFVLDCQSLDYEILPLGNPAPAIIVCDSKTSRRLADGMYNRRRAEGERVAAHFQRRNLRAVTLDELLVDWTKLDPVGRLRARHVLTENERVSRGAEALKLGDVAAFGALMSASHASSRDDFANSSAALDALIDVAQAAPGFLGGKLSGAGWAGCTVNLVLADQAEAFAEAMKFGYETSTGLVPDIHICHAADGASVRVVES